MNDIWDTWNAPPAYYCGECWDGGFHKCKAESYDGW
jgi:hypothetical protein